MAYELGPDGKPVEIASSYSDKNKTKPPQKASGDLPTTAPGGGQEGATSPPAGRYNPAAGAEPPTQPRGAGGGGQSMFGHIDEKPDPNMRPKGMGVAAEPPTKPKSGGGEPGGEPVVPKPQNVPAAEPKTRIHQRVQPSSESSQELVCGWLVIIDGPGKGSCLIVGNGQSFVSRSKNERICLDFGDDTITSGQQFRIIYDDEGREFIIGPGDGANPTRLNRKILASSMSLVTGDTIKAGQTTMRFVAFCSDDFSWE